MVGMAVWKSALRMSVRTDIMLEELSKNYWEDVWKDIRLPSSLSLDEIADQHNLLIAFLPAGDAKITLIEVGCAPGRWMHYFSEFFGYVTTGLDYATDACEITKQNLALLHTKAEIINEDFLKYRSDAKKFDVVFSNGFIEHFADVNTIIAKMVELMNPQGGYIATIIPNLYGLNGLISKTFRPRVFYGHVPITLCELISFHEDNGVRTLFADYVGGYSITPPVDKNEFSSAHPRISRLLNLPIVILDVIMREIEMKANKFPRSVHLSPSLMYIGRKLEEK